MRRHASVISLGDYWVALTQAKGMKFYKIIRDVTAVYIRMYRMTNGRLEVRIFLFKRTILLPVEVIRPMFILLNYRLKHLKRR